MAIFFASLERVEPRVKNNCLGIFFQPDHFATNTIQWDRPFKPKTNSWTKLRNNYVSGIEIQSHEELFSLGYLGYSMRPKARGLAHHGGLPDWLEESDSASVSVRDGLAVPPAFSVPYRLPWPELHGCELMEFQAAFILQRYTTIRHEIRHARKAWFKTLVDPCLFFGDTRGGISAAIACSILNPRGAFLLHK
jgi:hypothetical protein